MFLRPKRRPLEMVGNSFQETAREGNTLILDMN